MFAQHPHRREKLLKRIRQHEFDALLITGEKNVRWLTGFTGDSSWLLLGPTVCVLISDSRYTTQIGEECPGLDVSIREVTARLPEAAAKAIRAARCRRLAVEGHLLSVELMAELTGLLPRVDAIGSMSWQVEELRAVKDRDEIAEIRAAVHLAHRAYDYLRAMLTPEATELQLAHEMEHAMRRLGAAGVSFPPIIAADDRAALPHYQPSSRLIANHHLLLVDWGAETITRYKSDLTRVLVLDRPSKKLQKIYGIVLRATGGDRGDSTRSPVLRCRPRCARRDFPGGLRREVRPWPGAWHRARHS